jgi:hypothetical protein
VAIFPKTTQARPVDISEKPPCGKLPHGPIVHRHRSIDPLHRPILGSTPHLFESTGPSRSCAGPFTDTTAPPTCCTPSRPLPSLHRSAATGPFATGTGPAIDTTAPPPCCAPPSTGTPFSSTTPPARLRPARLHPLIPPALRLAARLPRPEPRLIAEQHRPIPDQHPSMN